MYDKKVLHLLDKIIESVEVILERTETVDSVNAFLDSSTGTLLLDGVCMKLIAVGESIKNLDKLTTGGLLVHYPQISFRICFNISSNTGIFSFTVLKITSASTSK